MKQWSDRVAKFNQFAFEYPCLENELDSYDPELAHLVTDFQIQHSSLSIEKYSLAVETFLNNHKSIEDNIFFGTIQVHNTEINKKYEKEAKKAMSMLTKKIKSNIAQK